MDNAVQLKTKSYFAAILKAAASLVDTSGGLDATLQRICGAIVSIPQYKHALVSVFQEDNNTFKVAAFTGAEKKLVKQVEEILGFSIKDVKLKTDYYDNIAIIAVNERKILTSTDLSNITHPFVSKIVTKAAASLIKISSYAVAPLFVGDELMGGMFVTSRQPEFTTEELDAMGTFANTAAVAIYNAKANDAMYASEEQHRLIVESSSDLIAIHSEGKWAYANPAALNLLGFSELRDLLGKPFINIIHPESRKNVQQRIRQLFKEQKPVSFAEVKMISSSEDVIDVEVTAIPITYRGKPAAMTIARDITERKRAEEVVSQLLEVEKNRVKQIGGVIDVARQVRLGIPLESLMKRETQVISDTLGWQTVIIIRCNPDFTYIEFATGIGISKSDLNNLVDSARKAAGTKPRFIDHFLREEFLLSKSYFIPEESGGSEYLDEPNVFVDRPDRYVEGDWKPGDFMFVLIRDRKGNGLGIITVDRPKDGRRPNETDAQMLELYADQAAIAIENSTLFDKVKESESKHRSLLEDMNDGFTVVDKYELFIMVNSRFCEIMGCRDESELLGRTMFEFINDEDQQIVNKAIERRKTGISETYELRVRRFDGREAIVGVSASPILDENSNYIGSSAVITDLTEKKEKEKLEIALYAIAEAANNAKSTDSLYPAIHKIIKGLMPAQNFSLAFYNSIEDLITWPYFVDKYRQSDEVLPRKPAKGLTDLVLQKGGTFLLSANEITNLSKKGKIKLCCELPVQWLGVPLKLEEQIIGVLTVRTYFNEAQLTENHKKILEFVSTEIAQVLCRKRAEGALKEAHELLSKTFASLDEAVFVLNPVTRKIIACNDAVKTIFGYTEAEVIGKNTEFLHVNKKRYERFGQELFNALDENGIFHTEFEIKRKNGEIFHSEHTVTEILDDKGHRTSLVSVVRDITERKRAADILTSISIVATKVQSLLSPEDIYLTLSDELKKLDFQTVAFRFSDDKKIAYLECISFSIQLIKNLEKITGLKEKDYKIKVDEVPLFKDLINKSKPVVITEVIEKSVGFYVPGIAKAIVRKILKVLKINKAVYTPIILDGDVVGTIILLTAEPITPFLPAMSVFSAQVSNALKNAELFSKLKQSEEDYRGLFNSTTDAIFIHDKEGRFVDVNPAVIKMYGYTKEELIGQSPEMLTDVEKIDISDAKEYISKAFAGESQHFEWWGKRKNGDIFPKDVVLMKTIYQGKEAVIASARDITETKKAEAELAERLDELERFQKVTVGRELRMIELKKKISKLEGQLKNK